METELEMQQASDSMKEALRGDNPAETRSMDASREELSQLVGVSELCLHISSERQDHVCQTGASGQCMHPSQG